MENIIFSGKYDIQGSLIVSNYESTGYYYYNAPNKNNKKDIWLESERCLE